MNFVRRTAQAIVIMLTLIVGATAAAIIVSQTAWFKEWLRGYIVREAHQYLNGQITIERLGGNLFDDIRLNRPVLYMRHDDNGWSIARLIKRQQQEADRQGPQFPIAISDIGIS